MSIIREELVHKITDENSNVFFTLNIGDDQQLTGAILCKPDGTYHNAPLNELNIGLGKHIKNKVSKLTVIVTDTKPKTNWTSIIIELTNEVKNKSYSGESTIDNGTVIYIIKIKHV